MTDDRAGAKPSPDAQWLRAIPGRNHLGRLEAVVDEVLTMRPRRIMQVGSRQRFDGNRTMEAGGAANQSDLPKRRIRVTGNAYQYKPGYDVVKDADVSLRTCHRGVLCQECTGARDEAASRNLRGISPGGEGGNSLGRLGGADRARRVAGAPARVPRPATQSRRRGAEAQQAGPVSGAPPTSPGCPHTASQSALRLPGRARSPSRRGDPGCPFTRCSG